MSMAAADITVIIPTTCEAQRWESLLRAIDSVFRQSEVAVQLLLVVNGQRVDPSHYEALCQMPGLVVVRLAEGLPMAQRMGRSLVTTPYFSFLDDDDEYLPGGLLARLAPLEQDSAVDFVASQGVRCLDGVDHPCWPSTAAIHRDPLRALSDTNWLASCGGLFRTRSISIDFFDGRSSYLEWTLLAYKLAISRRMAFVDTPAFRIHDSSGSLSKSTAYRYGEIVVIQQILQLELPGDVRDSVRIKLGNAHHSLSDFCRRQHLKKDAWRHHVASLMQAGGWRFIPYTRKLLAMWWRRDSPSDRASSPKR